MKMISPKLAAYSASALLLLSAKNATAQLYYYDFSPDLELNYVFDNSDSELIDIDFDGVEEVAFFNDSDVSSPGYSATFEDLYLSHSGHLQFAADWAIRPAYSASYCSGGTLIYFPEDSVLLPSPLPNGIVINDSMQWGEVDGPLKKEKYGSGIYAIANNAFLAFKMERPVDTLYGWIRFSWDGIDMSIHDFAFQSGLNDSLVVGDTSSYVLVTPSVFPEVDNLIATDPALCNSLYNSIELTFDYSFESLVDEYRMFVVEEADAASFDLAAAQALSSLPVYWSISPPVSFPLVSYSSISGLALDPAIPYRLFIHTIPKSYLGIPETLSVGSNAVYATSGYPVIEIQDLVASDVGDFDIPAAENLLVSYNQTNESCVEKYIAAAVDSSSGFALHPTLFDGIPPNQKTELLPSGLSSYTFNFADKQAFFGEEITRGKTYNIFVLVKGDPLDTMFQTSVKLTTPLSNSSGTGNVGFTEQQLFYFGEGTLQFNSHNPEGRLRLFSADGKILLDQMLLSGQKRLRLPELSNGVYFATFETDKKAEMLKFAVTN